MRRVSVLVVSVTLMGLAVPLLSQTQTPAPAQTPNSRLGGELGPRYEDKELASKPIPRQADGKVDFSGVWRDGGGDPRPEQLEPYMLPWAKKVLASRKETDNPYFQCMPQGPLRMSGGMAWRFIQPFEATHLFWLYEGSVHSYRQIFMNAKHPEDPDPTWYGHSIGRWEGDTLVVDTIGLNDKWWLNTKGAPHTEQLHLIERWTRTDYITLRRVVTIDDPGTYTKPIEVTAYAKLTKPESEILEYLCQENNQYGKAGGITFADPDK